MVRQAYGNYDIYSSELQNCIRSDGLEWPASAAEMKQYGKSRALLLLIKKISKEVGKMMHNIQCSIVKKLQLQYSFTDGNEVGFAFTQHIEKTALLFNVI